MIAVFTVRPIPIVKERDAVSAIGVVAQISEGPSNDVIIQLQGDATIYYINRGLENGLELNVLQERLTGQPVTLKYPNYWTPLDWNRTTRHISKLEFQGDVLFNELRQ